MTKFANPIGLSIAVLAFAACAGDSAAPPLGEDLENLGDHVIHGEKSDEALALAGFYVLDEDSILNDEYPLIHELDLRNDGSFVASFSMLSPSDDMGNVSIGWAYPDGRFRPSTARNKTYLYFYDEGQTRASMVWRYTNEGDSLVFHYRDSGSFTLVKKAGLDDAWTTAVLDRAKRYVGGEGFDQLRTVDRFDPSVPEAVRTATENADTVFRIREDGKYAYISSETYRVQVFATSGQRIGVAELVDEDEWEWAE